MSGTITSPGMSAYFWYLDHWVKFRLNSGSYQNIIAFLEFHKLLFLAEMELDFTKIPTPLHGKGISINLFSYLSNNIDDNSLILNFINYFIVETLKMKYASGKKVFFHLNYENDWTNMVLSFLNNIPTTTTTTTTAATTTTTTTAATTTTTTTAATTTTTTTTAETTTTTTLAETTTTTTLAETTTTTTLAETTTTTTLAETTTTTTVAETTTTTTTAATTTTTTST